MWTVSKDTLKSQKHSYINNLLGLIIRKEIKSESIVA